MRSSPLLHDGRALLDADRLIREKLADRRASYELSFARLPPHTGYLVVAGLETLLETLRAPLVSLPDLERSLRAGGFSEELQNRIAKLSPTVDIDAVPDGTVAFARAPIASVEGPFLEAVLLGGLLLSCFQRGTAIATRTARLTVAAGDDAVVDGSSAHVVAAASSFTVARAAHVGGASSTTNLAASAALGIPFRASPRIELGALAPRKDDASASRGWGDLPAEDFRELGMGDDEEAMLLEAKRLGGRAAGWIARGLADVDGRAFAMRYELVALEQDGGWAPRRGATDAADVVPGRKMVVRYSDANRRAVADVVHLNNERMQAPRSVGADTLAPLARPVMRGGRTLEAPETPQAGRDRAVTSRRSLSPEVTHLRAPAPYPVELSAGLRALR